MEDLFKDFTGDENPSGDEPQNPNPGQNQNVFDPQKQIQDFLSDDDDDVLIPGFNLDPMTNQKKEFQDPLLADIEKKKVENQAPDNDDDFLKKYNEKFGTTFKDEQELKEAMKSNVPDKTVKLTAEQEQKFEKNNQVLQSLEAAERLGNRELLLLHHLGLEKQKMGEDFDREIAESEISEKLNSWDQNGTLEFNASELRKKLNGEISKIKTENDELNKIKTSEIEKVEKEKLDAIQKEIIDIYKSQDFFGIKLEKDVMNKIYNSIVTNEFSERLNSNPKLMIQLAIMDAYKEEISKRSTRPTADYGRKEVLDELIPNSSKQGLNQARGGIESKGNNLSLVDSLLYNGAAK